MTTLKSLVTQSGTTKQIPDGDTLNVGAGIDGAGASLSIGSATTTTITIGDPLGTSTTVFPGPVQLDGTVNTVLGTTFTTDAVFQGNVTFGTGVAPDETVTFNGATVSSDIAFTAPGFRVTNMLVPLSAQDGATKAYADLKLALTGGTMSGAINMGATQINNLGAGTLGTDAVNLNQLNAVSGFKYDQEIFVAKNGSDVTGTGAVLNPFASITAAMAAITDASPTKRYAIRVEPGAYTEAGALNLKPNVFIIGPVANAVRVTATSFGLDATFTGAGDNRTGFSQMVLIGAATFDFATVTSSAGKLYCQSVTFNSAVTLTGFNEVNQAQFDSCIFFGAFTVSGVNVGVHTNNFHYANVVLTQAGTGLPTILNAAGGRLGGTLTATTTVNDINRRIGVFAYSFWMNGAVTIDGPSSYLDYTVDSLPSGGASNPNGGNLVSVDYGANKALSNLVYPTAVNNPIIPATTSATNMGDWDKQWFFSFAYVFTSSGTDLYIGSAGTSAAADSTGRGVYLQSDQYGLQTNVNGGMVGLYTSNATGTGVSGDVEILTGTSVNGNSGDVTITTGTPSGTGTRGVISLDGAEVDVNSKKITNLANGTNPNDAVNYSQLSAIVSGVSSFQTSLSGLTPSSATGGAITLAGTLGVLSGGTGATTLTGYLSGNGTSAFTASASIPGSDVSGDISGNAANVTGTVAVDHGGTGATTLTSGSLLAGNGTGTVAEIAPGGDGQVLTVVSGAWVSQAVPAATDYSVVGGITTAQVANTAVTVGGAAAIATTAAPNTARVAGIVKATNSVQVLGIVTCIVESTSPAIVAGDVVYLSASEAGKVTKLAPSVTGEVIAELGIATAPASGSTVAVLWQPKSITVL